MIEDLIAIGTLIFLEGILSVDNALAMALQVRSLEGSLQRRALLYGMWGALVLRAAALFGAKWLMHIWWLQIAGALYLFYLAITHFARRSVPHQAGGADTSSRGFWMTVAMVELTDAAFALDSTLVAVGMSDQMWVIFSGVGLGIVAVRYAAVLFVKLLARCPEIEHLGFVLVGWIAARLLGEGYGKMSASLLQRPYTEHIMPDWLFWTVVAILIGVGAVLSVRPNLSGENRIVQTSVRLMRSCRNMAHRHPFGAGAWRIAVMIIGSIVLLAGVAMIFLPGPAILVIPAGLAILATEFAWARSLLNRGRASLRGILRT